MLHKLGALVAEVDQVLVGLDEIDALAEEPGDMELCLPDLDDSVGGDRGAADAIPADRTDLVSWPPKPASRPSPKTSFCPTRQPINQLPWAVQLENRGC